MHLLVISLKHSISTKGFACNQFQSTFKEVVKFAMKLITLQCLLDLQQMSKLTFLGQS